MRSAAMRLCRYPCGMVAEGANERAVVDDQRPGILPRESRAAVEGVEALAVTVEQEVARHYTHGALADAVLDALLASGKDIERLSSADLWSVDEFHLGWHAATVDLVDNLDLCRHMHVLDVGAGLGGAARYMAKTWGCRVTGIGLTAEYVSVANSLTRRCGLADIVSFQQASALDLPYGEGVFDAATLIHVGMNVPDKARLFSEVRRVLKPEGCFGVYDVVSVAEGGLSYPMPWAATAEMSFLEPVQSYRQLLTASGFLVEREHDKTALALKLGREMREKVVQHGPPPLGIHLLMGSAAFQRIGNMMTALENGVIAPVMLIARAV